MGMTGVEKGLVLFCAGVFLATAVALPHVIGNTHKNNISKIMPVPIEKIIKKQK